MLLNTEFPANTNNETPSLDWADFAGEIERAQLLLEADATFTAGIKAEDPLTLTLQHTQYKKELNHALHLLADLPAGYMDRDELITAVARVTAFSPEIHLASPSLVEKSHGQNYVYVIEYEDDYDKHIVYAAYNLATIVMCLEASPTTLTNEELLASLKSKYNRMLKQAREALEGAGPKYSTRITHEIYNRILERIEDLTKNSPACLTAVSGLQQVTQKSVVESFIRDNRIQEMRDMTAYSRVVYAYDRAFRQHGKLLTQNNEVVLLLKNYGHYTNNVRTALNRLAQGDLKNGELAYKLAMLETLVNERPFYFKDEKTMQQHFVMYKVLHEDSQTEAFIRIACNLTFTLAFWEQAIPVGDISINLVAELAKPRSQFNKLLDETRTLMQIAKGRYPEITKLYVLIFERIRRACEYVDSRHDSSNTAALRTFEDLNSVIEE